MSLPKLEDLVVRKRNADRRSELDWNVVFRRRLAVA